MIKFNFHIKTSTTATSRHNGSGNPGGSSSLTGKDSWKIILIIFGVFFLFGITAFIGFFSIAFGGISSVSKGNDDRREQWKKIRSLPLLKCKIYTSGTVSAPLSGTPAAFYLLRVGTEQYVSYKSPGTNGRSYINKELVENFDYAMAAGYPRGTRISVNGKLYTISFQKAIMDTTGNGEMYFTKKIINKNPRKYSRNVPFSYADYRTAWELRDRHPWISSFYDDSYRSGFKNIVIKEYAFSNGDSLYIKGKISGNTLFVYHEHMLHTPSLTQKEIEEGRNEEYSE